MGYLNFHFFWRKVAVFLFGFNEGFEVMFLERMEDGLNGALLLSRRLFVYLFIE